MDTILSHDDNTIIVDITPDMYESNDVIKLMPVVELNENQTLHGNTFEIKVEDSEYKKYDHTYGLAENNRLIMHAGGAWEGYTYTNCLEAFQSNYEKGCMAFKLDLMLTSDDVIVGRHDWTTVLFNQSLVAEDELSISAYQRNNLPKTYKELCDMYEGRTPLTWMNILDYLLSDESLYIVTDTKYYNDEAVDYLFSKMVDEAKKHHAEKALGRVVVQVYNQDMYQKVMDVYPFKEIIYSLYQSADSNEEVLDFIDNSNVKIITLAKNSFRDNDTFFQDLIDRGC